MNKIRPIILSVAAVIVSLMAYGVFKGISLNTLLASLNFGKTTVLVFSIVLSIVFCLLFALECVRGRMKLTKVLKKSGWLLLSTVIIFIVGQLAAWAYNASAGLEFNLYGKVQQEQSPADIIVYGTMVLVFAITVALYLKGRAKALRGSSSSMRANAAVNAANHYAYTTFYGALTLAFVPSVVMMFMSGYNEVFWIPVSCAVVSMVLYHMTNLRLCLLLGISAILLHIFPAIQYLYVYPLTIGSLGTLIAVAFLEIMILIPLVDLYVMPVRKR